MTFVSIAIGLLSAMGFIVLCVAGAGLVFIAVYFVIGIIQATAMHVRRIRRETK